MKLTEIETSSKNKQKEIGLDVNSKGIFLLINSVIFMKRLKFSDSDLLLLFNAISQFVSLCTAHFKVLISRLKAALHSSQYQVRNTCVGLR